MNTNGIIKLTSFTVWARIMKTAYTGVASNFVHTGTTMSTRKTRALIDICNV